MHAPLRVSAFPRRAARRLSCPRWLPRLFPLPLLLHGCLLVSPLDEPLDDAAADGADDPYAPGASSAGAGGSQNDGSPTGADDGGTAGSGGSGEQRDDLPLEPTAGSANAGGAGAANADGVDDPAPPAGAYQCGDPIAAWTTSGPHLVRFDQLSGDCPPLPNATWPLEADANCSTDITTNFTCGYTETSFCIGYDVVTELSQSAADAPVTGTLSYAGAARTSAGAVDCEATYALSFDELPAQHTCDPAVDFAGVFRVIVGEPVVDLCGQVMPGVTDAQYVDPASVTEGCEVLAEERGPCTYAAAFDCGVYSGAVAMGQEIPGGIIGVYFEGTDDLGCDVEYGVQYLPADLP